MFLKNVQITGAQLPLQSFSFFITSQTQGYAPIASNSQDALCLQGSTGRFVGPSQIQTSGATRGTYLDLNAQPTSTGLVSVQQARPGTSTSGTGTPSAGRPLPTSRTRWR